MSQSTLLEMVNSVLLELRFDQVATVIGNTTKDVATVYQAVRDSAEIDVYRGNSWACLLRELTITFDGSDEYMLPSDFDYVVNDTDWDVLHTRPATGGLTPIDWNRIKYSELSTPQTVLYWMQIGHDFGPGTGLRKALIFYPTPIPVVPPAVGFSCFYVSNWYVIDGSTRESKIALTSDQDTYALDTSLVEQGALVRMLSTLGLPHQAEQQDFQDMLDERRRKDQAMRNMNMEGRGSRIPAYPNTPGYTPVAYGRRWSR